MTPLEEVSQLLDWFEEHSDEMVARTRDGRTADREIARLVFRMRYLAGVVATRLDSLVDELPALTELRDHARAIDVLFARALEMYPVPDQQAVGSAGKHAAHLVASAGALREELGRGKSS